MSVQDFLIRGLLREEKIRFVYVNSSQTIASGIKIHDTDPVAALIFGRALTATALLTPLLHDEERYSIRWEYPGQLEGIITDVNAKGDVRGFIRQPHLVDKVTNEEQIYGKKNGTISVIKSIEGKVLNSGKTNATFADPATDLGFYFSLSDQIETEIVVAEHFNPSVQEPVKISSGLMIQSMPGCDLELFNEYRTRLQNKDITELLKDQKLPMEKKLWSLLAHMAGSNSPEKVREDAVYEQSVAPGFRCSCSREKMKQAVQVLGEEEIAKLYRENKNPAIACQFCHKQYRFEEQELIISKKSDTDD